MASGFGPSYNELMYRKMQNRALGRPLRPEEIEAVMESQLASERQKAIANRMIEMQEEKTRTAWEENKKAQKQAKAGQAMSGLGQLAKLGMEGYDMIYGNRAGIVNPTTPGEKATYLSPTAQPTENVKLTGVGRPTAYVPEKQVGMSIPKFDETGDIIGYENWGGSPSLDIKDAVIEPPTLDMKTKELVGDANINLPSPGNPAAMIDFATKAVNPAEFLPGLYNAALPTVDVTRNTLNMLPGLLENSAMLEFMPDATLGASALGGAGTQGLVNMTPAATGGLGNIASSIFQNPNIMGLGGSALTALGQTEFGQNVLPGGAKEDAIGAGMAGGAMAGSSMGPVGAVVGGLIGGAMSAFGGKKKTVICTALHHHGMIDDTTFELDGLYGDKLAETIEGRQILYGYRDLFTGLAEKMKKHKWLAKIVKTVAMPVVREMAHEVDPQRDGSLVGKAMLSVGKKLCHFWFGVNIWKFIGREI